MLKTISYSERVLLVLTLELISNGTVFVTMCRAVNLRLRKNVLNYRLLFSTNPFDLGSYGVRGLNVHCIYSQNV